MKTSKKLLSVFVLMFMMVVAMCANTMTAYADECSGSGNHDWKAVTGVYQSQGSTGHKQQQKCSKCNATQWSTSTNGHQLVVQEDQYDATGHISSPKYKRLSDTQHGIHKKCSACGYEEYTAANCSFTTDKNWSVKDAKQHVKYKVCTVCGQYVVVETKDHTNWKNDYAGGSEGHQQTRQCGDCGYAEIVGNLVSHTWGAPAVVNDTQTNTKTTTTTCTVCGYQDIVSEVIPVSYSEENATVMSSPLSLAEIKAAAGSSVTTPFWMAAVGKDSTFDVSKVSTDIEKTDNGQTKYAWEYAGNTYTLSQRSDGLYYIVKVPAYFWYRLVENNANGKVTTPSGYTSSSSYTSNTNAPNGYQYGDTSTSYGKADHDIWTASQQNPNAPLTSSGGYSYKPVDSSYTGDKMTAPNGQTVAATRDPVTGELNPTLVSTQTVSVHHCSYSTSYQDTHADPDKHQKTVTGCCSGSSRSQQAHQFTDWTYTDLGMSLHRGERVCKQCGHVETKVEAHEKGSNKSGKFYCTKCNRLLSVIITWHWYDEHTPVTQTTEQKYYEGLITPAARGRQDYKFTGWWTEWGGVGVEWFNGDDYPYGSPDTLYASWQAIIEREDYHGPIITVVREPQDADTPTTWVRLIITAVDLEGNDVEKPLQVEGETEWHASPYTYTVTEPGLVTIVARDAYGNTREFLVNVTNLDVESPAGVTLTPSTTAWTQGPVTVTAYATDDQGLHAQAYRWGFKANEPGSTMVWGSWTASNTYDVTRAGIVQVEVRDSLENNAFSAPLPVYNIDTIAPGLDKNVPYEVSETGTVAASTGVTISLNLLDIVDPVTGVSSGLSNTPIRWVDMGEAFGTMRVRTVHRNETYYVIIKDAVGNESAPIPITINNISTSEPVIQGVTMTDVDGDVLDPNNPSAGDKAPITVHVDATFGDAGEREDGKSYSYDGGITWTTLNWFIIDKNGEYTILVRDKTGTTKEQTIVLNTIDNADPLVTITLFKGVPDDWTTRFGNRECKPEDWVWKLSVVAVDPPEGNGEGVFQGSGIRGVYCQWNGETKTPGADGTVSFVFDVKQPQTFQVTVTDNAGHSVQAEKVVQWTDLDESVYGPNPNVPIEQPDVKPGSSKDWEHGSAGSPFDANLEDLVFGPDGAFNTQTGEYTPYPPNAKGIPVNFNASITRNKWATGFVTFNNKTYPVSWGSTDVTGLPTTRESYEGKTDGKVLGTGNLIPGHAFIPISDIQGDVKNGRIRVTVREWNDQACTDLNKEGIENFYTSVQNSKPTITYTYNRGIDEMVVIATSSMSKIDKVQYKFDSGSFNDYSGPFGLGSTPPAKVTLYVKDVLGLDNTLEIDVANLGLLGNTAGTPNTDTMSQDNISGGLNSSHSSNRAADIFIIGGTRGNTDAVPGAQVFNNAFN